MRPVDRKTIKIFQMSGHGGRREGAGRKPGVPNKCSGEIRGIAREFGPAAITRLAELAGLAPGERGEGQAVQVAALKELLDRGYGKATQPMSGDRDMSPVSYEFRWADATPQPEPELMPPAADTDQEDMQVVWANTC